MTNYSHVAIIRHLSLVILNCLEDDGFGIEVGRFDVFEVAVGRHFEVGASVFVGNDYGVGVELESGDGPHLGDCSFNAVMEGAGLVVAVDEKHDFTGVHNGAYAHGESSLGHEVDIAVEEAGVGDDGVLREGLHAGAGCERGAGFVESDVTVGTYAAHEEVDAAVLLDFFFEATAFGFGIFGVAVEDIYVFSGDVDVGEEVGPHECVVAFLVVAGKVAVFVHVECDDVGKRHLAFFVEADEFAVHSQGRSAGGATEHERMFGSGFCVVDGFCHEAGSPYRHLLIVFFYNKAHDKIGIKY